MVHSGVNWFHGEYRKVCAAERFDSGTDREAREGAGEDREDERQPGAGGFDRSWPCVQGGGETLSTVSCGSL